MDQAILRMKIVPESRDSELDKVTNGSDKQMDDCGPSLSSPSPTIPSTNSYNVESSNFENGNCSESRDSELDKVTNGKIVLLADDRQPQDGKVTKGKRDISADGEQPEEEEHKQFKPDQAYHYIPQETSLSTDILVKIDDIFVKQDQLLCLLDSEKFLNDDVISAYICCIKDEANLRSRDDLKLYFENPFISAMLKGDGNLGINGEGNYITKTVRNYLKHDMVLIPINIKDTHWYLDIINAQKHEIQVFNSLCWEFNRADLTATLQGIQYHLNIIQKQENLISHNWKDLQVTTWTITEQLQAPIQKDGSSCGLFMLKFMEYWAGDTLSHHITQEDISHFRYKLAGILLCWKTNTAEVTPLSDQICVTEADSNDVTMLGSPDDQKEPKPSESLSEETKYQSLMSVLSKMSVHELVGGLCNYIKSINCVDTLEKVWVQNSKPYSISLTLRKLQEILKEDLPMDRDCFNLIIQKFMFDDFQIVKKNKGMISKHYLDMQFWMLTDFGRHPNFRKKLDVERLAESVRGWPGINYSVSRCKLILIPITESSAFILFILNQETRTVYISDPTLLDPIYENNPNAKYLRKLLWIAEYFSKAMPKPCPGSRWNEDIFLWRQIILPDIPIQNRELSGYLVSLFMCLWKDEELRLPILKDGYELRKQFMAQLLMYKENECQDNMPAGVQDFIRCINSAQS